jgi:hypothetical protein
VADTIVSALPDWEKRIREDERAKAEAEWKKAEKEIRSATEREVRARLRGEEPVPDPGAGAAPGSAGLPKTVPEMRAFIARLPASEYQKRESELDAHLAALLRGRRAA